MTSSCDVITVATPSEMPEIAASLSHLDIELHLQSSHINTNWYEMSAASVPRYGNITPGRTASEEVVLHLVKYKCMPILLYGFEAVSYTHLTLPTNREV